jgi:hypothetical protein
VLNALQKKLSTEDRSAVEAALPLLELAVSACTLAPPVTIAVVINEFTSSDTEGGTHHLKTWGGGKH